jgi:hypothetical protein
MDYFLVVVEGAHDAALVGKLLAERGFTKVRQVGQIDPIWAPLIPKVFPAQGQLEHVVKYPDMYTSVTLAQSVAVAAAGGFSQLLPELQASLDILAIADLKGIAILGDADGAPALDRFRQVGTALNSLNQRGVTNSIPGFPLALPTVTGMFAAGPPRLGVFILPDNVRTGTLETLLLECAVTSYAAYHQSAGDFVAQVDRVVAPGAPELRALRRANGREKAVAGAIGNVLFPGSNLSVAIERGSWLHPLTGAEPSIIAIRKFFADLLASP